MAQSGFTRACVVGDSGSDPFEGTTTMTDETTPHDPTDHRGHCPPTTGPRSTWTARAGCGCRSSRCRLSDSPGRDGATPNAPVRLYDTSGPGSVPTVGLPSLRRAVDHGAGRCRRVRGPPGQPARRRSGRGAPRRRRPGRLPARRPPTAALDRHPGHPAPLRPQGGDHPGDGLRGHPRRRARRSWSATRSPPAGPSCRPTSTTPSPSR